MAECSYDCEEELSKGVSEPCSEHDLCGSYHYIKDYNGLPFYKVSFMTINELFKI